MFVDFVRECQYKVGFLSVDTSGYCSSNKYQKCPFYRAIKKIGYSCRYLKKCPACEHFQINSFAEFISVATKYCLSEKNNKECCRYKIRKKGKTPDPSLMPDGTYFSRK